MKKSIIISALTTLLLVAVLSVVAFRNPMSSSKTESSNPIMGTWQLDSYKYYSTASSFTMVTPDRPHIKLITENMFLWATYDATTKQTLESAGGTYTLEGENYIESIDFGYRMDDFLGTKSNFKIKVEGDMFFLSGMLSGGLKIEEIWQKVK